MTAEVGVLNRVGVALAADSAVTMGGPGGKTYASADKLFHLSHRAPVGAMIYGNADFVGLPWETIIKAYRRHLGSRTFASLGEYADDFLGFMRSSTSTLFPKAHQDQDAGELIMQWFLRVRQMVNFELDRAAEREDGLSELEISKTVSARIATALDGVRQQPEIKELHGKHQALSKRYRRTIHELRKTIFGKLPMSRKAWRDLGAIALEGLRRTHFVAKDSGVVVAGFGEKEFLPSLLCFEMEGMVLNEPRYRQINAARVEPNSPAVVIPFAQQEVVCAFMEGIDPMLLQFMQAATEKLFTGSLDAVIETLESVLGKSQAKQLESQVKPDLQTMVTSMFQEWDKKRVSYWGPVLDAVAALPKDELAAMAENLVNLTKFRRRVTTEQETVGGPIDVAVITKGDGFVWVQRKHYFEPALNPRVMARYTSEG